MCWSCHEQFGAVKTSRSPQDSPLLDLPPEIRNKIYSYALIEPGHVYIFCVEKCRADRELEESDLNFYWAGPALLQSCRQIRKEASLLYYSSNSFITVDRGQWYLNLSSWMATLECANMRSVKLIIVDSDYERMLTVSLAQDVLRFWDEIQPTELALSKDTLRVILPVYKPIPTTLKSGFPFEEFLDTPSVSRIEHSWVFANCLMENDDHPNNPRNVRRDLELTREEMRRELEEEGETVNEGPPCYSGDTHRVFDQ